MSLYTCRLLISIYQGKHKHWIITRFSHSGIEHIVDFTTFLPDSVSTPIRRFRDHLTAHLASRKWVCKGQKCVLAAEDNYSETPECGGIIPNTQQTDQHAPLYDFSTRQESLTMFRELKFCPPERQKRAGHLLSPSHFLSPQIRSPFRRTRCGSK